MRDTMFHTNRVPLLHRPTEGDCRLILPYERGNRQWIKDAIGSNRAVVEGRKTRNGYVWTFNRSHFTKVVEQLNYDYHVAVVYLDSYKNRPCDQRCMGAVHSECVCSCGGYNHGGLRDYMIEWSPEGTVSDVDDDTQRVAFTVGFETDVLEPWQYRKLGVSPTVVG